MVMEYVLIVIAVVGIVYFIHNKRNTNNNVNSTPAQLNATEVTETIEQVTIVRNGVVEKGTAKMGQGLEVYDSSGNSIFNSSTMNFKRLGSFSVSGTAGSHVDDNIVGKNIVFFVEKIRILEDGDALYDVYPTSITVSGNTIKWNYNFYQSVEGASGWASNYHERARKGKQEITFAYGWV
jgi:hypothetical protein